MHVYSAIYIYDFQIAVAAAIGVGGEFGEASFRTNNLANRMRNKLHPRVPNIPRRGQTVMGEINRSIEKMSLGDGSSSGVKNDAKPRAMAPGPHQTNILMQNNRRDSSWTVSTEGYGSMRSNTSASRRCSELSQVTLNIHKICASFYQDSVILFCCQFTVLICFKIFIID